MAKMGGPWGVEMRLSLWYGHGSREVVLALRRGHDFERSPYGFCNGWQNGFPGTLKSCSRAGMGRVPAFSRSGAGETQLFPFGIMDSANSGFRPFDCFRVIAFFDPLIFTAIQPPRNVFCAFARLFLFAFLFLQISSFFPTF